MFLRLQISQSFLLIRTKFPQLPNPYIFGPFIPSNLIFMITLSYKARLGFQKNSVNGPEANQTSLSNHIWNLKTKNLDYRVSWKLIDQENHTLQWMENVNCASKRNSTSSSNRKWQPLKAKVKFMLIVGIQIKTIY